MDVVTPEFLTKYQQLYESDPKSRVFAPLAEAYRKSGHLQKALSICKKGCQQHPLFASGHVSMGRIYKDLKQFDKAMIHLQRAVSLAPENIQAYQIMAEINIENKNSKGALEAFKQVLFLNPHDQTVIHKVKRLESLSADEFDEDTFQIGSLFESDENPLSPAEKIKGAERIATLIDAFLVRNEFEKAKKTLEDGIQKYGKQKELLSRLKMIESQKEQSHEDIDEDNHTPVSRSERLFTANQLKKKYRKAILQQKIETLNELLERISDKKSSYFSYDP